MKIFVLASISACQLILETSWLNSICSSTPDLIAVFDPSNSLGTTATNLFYENYSPDLCGYDPLVPNGCCLQDLRPAQYASVIYFTDIEDIIQGNYCHIRANDTTSLYNMTDLYLRQGSGCNQYMICSADSLIIYNDEICSIKVQSFNPSADVVNSVRYGNVTIQFTGITTGPKKALYEWVLAFPAIDQTIRWKNPLDITVFVLVCIPIILSSYRIVMQTLIVYERKSSRTIIRYVICISWFARSIFTILIWIIRYPVDLEWQFQQQISEILFNVATLLTVFESITQLLRFTYVNDLWIIRGSYIFATLMNFAFSGARYFDFLQHTEFYQVYASWSFYFIFWLSFMVLVNSAIPTFLFIKLVSLNTSSAEQVLRNFVFIARKYRFFFAFVQLHILNSALLITSFSISAYTQLWGSDMTASAIYYLSSFFQYMHAEFNMLLVNELRRIFAESSKQLGKSSKIVSKGVRKVKGEQHSKEAQKLSSAKVESKKLVIQ